jgi:5-methyltetrahydropteroyltriglutamate--homocysteine methyltransferase
LRPDCLAAEYRADQVGSLLRPPELLAAREAHAAGMLTLEQLRAVEDEAILTALEMQRAAGIDVFTDGELRRRAWMSDLAEAVEGFTPGHVELEWRGPGGGVEHSQAQVAGNRLRQTRRLTAHEVAFLKAHAPGPFKMTVPAPSTFLHAGFQPGVTDQAYPTRAALAQDIASIIQSELLALAEEGVPYLQLDAPFYSSYLDETLRERMRRTGTDPERDLQDAVDADNAALEGIARDGLTLGIHICRGNSRSRWIAEGGYDHIAERLFSSLAVDRFLLEYDSDRAGGFAPLRHVPEGKTVVLGLVSTKIGQMETLDALRRRVEEAAHYVPQDRLAISPQCGFASTALGNNVSMDEERRKLALVVETAHAVWG